MDFGLQRFDLTTTTRRLELPEVSADPTKPLTLIVRYCGVGNKAWESLMFQRAAERKASVDQEILELVAPSDPPPVPDHSLINATLATSAIADWEHVLSDGQPVTYTPEIGAQFLAELDEHCPDVWRRVTNYAVERSNFRSTTPIDAVALGKG